MSQIHYLGNTDVRSSPLTPHGAGDHLRLLGQHGESVGRGEWRDGQHSHPPLRGRPSSQLQL